MTTNNVDGSIQLSPKDAPAHKVSPKWFSTAKVRRLANTWLHQCSRGQFDTKEEEYEFKARSFTLFICTVYPDLKAFRPQILSYVQYCNRRYLNEGPQCLSALKAYKRAAEEMLDRGSQPLIRHKSWGRHKFAALKPLAFSFLSLIRELGDDKARIAYNAQGLNSILRFYDVYPSTRKELKAAEAKFVKNILTKKAPSIYPRVESQELVEKLNSMFESKWFKLSKLGKAISKQQDMGLNPPLGPRLATSSGLVKYKCEIEGKKSSGSLPSIVGAPFEIYKSKSVLMSYESGHQTEIMSVYDLNLKMSNIICSQVKLKDSIVPSEYQTEDVVSDKTVPGYTYQCDSMRRFVCIESNHKPRIIAKGDWASQSILQPVHDALFNILRGLSSDYAHCQTNGFKRLQSLVKAASNYVASKDLTAATDMFPLWFQRLVMEYVFGTDLADCWANIMCRVPFQDGYYYHTGQPMGMYSSWAAFALSHHVLVYLSAWVLGDSEISRELSWTPEEVYGICGDDVFIKHASLSDVYSQLMGQCNVTVNMQKSFIAVPGGLRIGEFVKRNSWQGYEISALSPNLIVGSFMDYSNAYQLFSKLRELDYPARTLAKLVELLEYGSVRGLNTKASTSRVISLMKNIPHELYGMSQHDAALLDNNLVIASLIGFIQSKLKVAPKVPKPGMDENSMSPFALAAAIPVPGLAPAVRVPLVEYLARLDNDEGHLVSISQVRSIVSNIMSDSLEYGIPICSFDIQKAKRDIDIIVNLPKVPSYRKEAQSIFLADFANRMSKCQTDEKTIKMVDSFLNTVVNDSRHFGNVTISRNEFIQSVARASS